jgi:hypothetical protein
MVEGYFPSILIFVTTRLNEFGRILLSIICPLSPNERLWWNVLFDKLPLIIA